MSGIMTPGDRPGGWQTAGDHERRVRALEALQPCCDDSGGASVGTYEEYVLSLSDLIGYWRLGEPAAPFADTSGFLPAADLSLVAGAVPLVTDVTGALPEGQDDGAVEFIAANTQEGDRLNTNEGRFAFTGGPADAYTVSCWVKLTANAATFSALVIGTWSPGNGGWYLGISYPTQAIFHFRQATGGTPQDFVIGPTVADEEWLHVATTFDPADGAYQLFYNGSLVATSTSTTVVPNFGLSFGTWGGGGPNYGSYPGSLDEAAIWNRVLTDEEIAGLWFYGTPQSEVEDEGKVRTADGAGGTTWAFPTIEVDPPGGRFNKINVGAGLTGVDEGDESVTLSADPAEDLFVWMPLTTVTGGVPELVWDADDSLIPTLVPL